MEGCDAVVNFAAESHVDRSIADQDAFARTHVIGTGVLLDAARERGVARYLQVSTDEVYGSIEEGSFTESSPLDPSSPYSATKAAGDLLVSAHAHTYGIEAVICRGSNNYGPRQYPEKLIPLVRPERAARRPAARLRRRAPGAQLALRRGLRRAIDAVLETRPRRARPTTSAAPTSARTSTSCARILELTGRDESLIEYVTRPPRPRPPLLARQRQDPRELGWEPQVRFAEGLERTVEWYRDNEWWWEPIRSGEYREYYERSTASRWRG